MGSIYTGNGEKSLIIYSYKQQIYLRIATGETLNRSILLASDYKASLTETIYEDTLFYAYQNINDNIVIKSIIDTSILFQLHPSDAGECSCPLMIQFADKLFLFYIIKNPINDAYSPKCIFPFHTTETFSLTGSYPTLPTMKSIVCNDRLLLVIDHENNSDILFIHKDGSIENYESVAIQDVKRTELSAFFEARRITLEQQLEEKSKTISVLEQDLQSCNQKIQSLEESLRRTKNELQNKDLMIESAKNQYNELMQTAKKYRDEANKWYGKFHDI